MIRDSSQSPVFTGSSWSGLFEKAREYYDNYSQKIDLLRYLNRADMTPFPVELAISKGVFFDPEGTRRQIRQSAYEAPAIQRKPVRFSVWKPGIDIITGSNSSVFFGNKIRNSFRIGMSIIGEGDAMDPAVDFQDIVSRLYEPALGMIMIDLGTGAPVSAGMISALVRLLDVLSRIYMVVELGYVVQYTGEEFTIGESVIGPPATIGASIPAGSYFVTQVRL